MQWLIATAVLLCSSESLPATDFDENEVLFARRIAALLEEKCIACHGGEQDDIQGGLDLRSTEASLLGGDTGEAAIVVGNAALSPLVLAASRESDSWSAMPPKDSEALSSEQLGWLRDWINGGAKRVDEKTIQDISQAYNERWSAEDGVTVKTSGGLADMWTNRRYDPAGMWAYQPVLKPDVEAINPSAAIDELLARHRPDGLATSPPATRAVWLRRASFDLTGLPPSAAEIQQFSMDPRDDEVAYAACIDRLLDSPHYGERMAQHWLDVVRYADSSGLANDFARGNAWRYRDYVVRSFNLDKPYDEFIREQIAGDELKPEDPEAVIATGFLRMGPWELTAMEVAKVARQRFLDDVTNSVGETFLGHALQCARCHDHKFDPIPTQDYYALQAVFATTQLAERRADFMPDENRQNFDEVKYLEERGKELSQLLSELDEVLLASAMEWYEANGRSPEQWLEAIEELKQEGEPISFNALRVRMGKLGLAQDDYPPKQVGFTPQQFGLERVARKGLERLDWERERYRPFALAVYNGRTPERNSVTSPSRIPENRLSDGELEQTCILTGGDPFSPGASVEPGVLSVLNDQLQTTLPNQIEGRRSELAKWIADARNPLTTRVIVNRIWQWHFGTAIAGNPNNFGSTGKRPTHPQLLDYLAATLVENGWQLKPLHRAIMLSAAYRQSSNHPEPDRLAELDPLGQAYSVFQRRRLTAEELRDAMLSVTGELIATVGGIPIRPEINPEVGLQPRQVMGTFAEAWSPNPLPSDRHRRSLYVLKLRGLTVPLFDVFNAPAPDFSCEGRENSMATPQVFALWNSRNSYARSLSLAIDVLAKHAQSQEAIAECFRRMFGREPDGDEVELCLQALHEVETILSDEAIAAARTPQQPPLQIHREAVEENTGERFTFDEVLYASRDYIADHDPDQIDRRSVALADVCLALFNSNEFVTID